MNVKVTIGLITTEVPLEVLSHAVTCHNLRLTEWTKEVKEKFIKKINLSDIDREEAERQLGWLYDDLDRIDIHRKSNDELKKILNQVEFGPITIPVPVK